MLVIVTDAHVLFRDGIEFALNEACSADCEVLHCDTYDQLQSSLKKSGYDLVVVGSNTLPDKSSQTLTKLRRMSGGSPVIISVDEPADVAQIKENGLDGVIEKTAPVSSHVKLFELITSAFRKHKNSTSNEPIGGSDKIRNLTPKQRQIWQLISVGLSNREIAEKMGLSEGTVKVHATSLYKRLSVKNRTQATLMAHDLFNQ